MAAPEELTPESAMEREFRARGFTHNLALTSTAVEDVASGRRWDPRDVRIIHEHRQEGVTNPSDEALLMAVETPDGVRGTLISSYGPEVEHADALRLLGTGVS